MPYKQRQCKRDENVEVAEEFMGVAREFDQDIVDGGSGQELHKELDMALQYIGDDVFGGVAAG